MAQAAERLKLSPEEYLALERASEQKHEYADGEIFAMAGGTREHSLTAANIIRELGEALIERPCEVHTSDLRVRVPSGRYFYPDASIVCGRLELEDATRDTLLNPTLLVEVLSDSTEAYDRGNKFAHYRGLASFKEYVLASQKEPLVEVFRRQADGSWVMRVYGAGERARLDSVGCELDVDRAYLKVFAQL
jgi:Uma2 family endonuclease